MAQVNSTDFDLSANIWSWVIEKEHKDWFYVLSRIVPLRIQIWTSSTLLVHEVLVTCARHSQIAGEKSAFNFIFHNQRRRIITEWRHMLPKKSSAELWCVNRLECNNQHVYKYFYFVKSFMPWTHRGSAPAAEARFSWCWQSDIRWEEQAVETKHDGKYTTRATSNKLHLWHSDHWLKNRFSWKTLCATLKSNDIYCIYIRKLFWDKSNFTTKTVYLALQFHPAALLLGLHLLGLVLFDALQETVPALWVLHMLNAHVDPLGQDSAPVKKKQEFIAVKCSMFLL